MLLATAKGAWEVGETTLREGVRREIRQPDYTAYFNSNAILPDSVAYLRVCLKPPILPNYSCSMLTKHINRASDVNIWYSRHDAAVDNPQAVDAIDAQPWVNDTAVLEWQHTVRAAGVPVGDCISLDVLEDGIVVVRGNLGHAWRHLPMIGPKSEIGESFVRQDLACVAERVDRDGAIGGVGIVLTN